MSLTIGSLFTGVAGFELGLEGAGLGPVLWQVEPDPFCRHILERRYPEIPRHERIEEVGAHNLARVDIVCGGFPCQDISSAGKGAGLSGARSGLWFEMLRVARELRPRFVVVENVAALVKRGLGTVLAGLAESGFDAVWFPLRASDVGAPHRRERLFVVAWRVSDAGGVTVRDQPRRRGRSTGAGEAKPGFMGATVANAPGNEGHRRPTQQPEDGSDARARSHEWPPGPDRLEDWDGPQPAVRRGADGFPTADHGLARARAGVAK